MSSPKQTEDAAKDAAREPAATPTQELAAEDFYYEGPYVVFTAAYHRKRGYCCESDCRHCPYKAEATNTI